MPDERHARTGDLAEKLHAHLAVIGAELQQARRRAQGRCVRVCVLKAARVRRDGDVQEVCLLLSHAAGQQLDKLEHCLAAGGFLRVQQRAAGVEQVRRVVVDAQIDRAEKSLREQIRRCDIDRDHTRGHKVRRRKKLRHIRQIARSCLRVGEQIRRLAHAAQCAAKRRTAPERVTVRAQVRQDQNRVAAAQGRCKLPIIHTSSLTSGVGIVQPLD